MVNCVSEFTFRATNARFSAVVPESGLSASNALGSIEIGISQRTLAGLCCGIVGHASQADFTRFS